MFRIFSTSLGMAALIAALAIDHASAQVVSVDELTDASALVVSGRVQSVTSDWDQQVNGIYTYALVEVAEVWKGPAATRQLVVKMLGGRVGDVELLIPGQARLEAGRDVALWLEIRPRDRTLAPTGFARGVHAITDGVTLEALRTSVRARAPDAQPPSFQAFPPEWRSAASGSFTYFPPGSEGGPARWHEADSLMRVFVDYQPPPSGLGGGVTEIDNAVRAWNGSGMNLQLQLGVTRTARCLATYENNSDGRISVSFDDPCGELGLFGATLGVGGGYLTHGEVRTINGQDFEKFLQGVVVLNRPAVAPALSQRGCFQDAITHNLGHTIGLGDSETASALMHVSYASRCGATPAPLAQDDIAGARSVYPTGLPNGVPGMPTNLTGSATGTTLNLSWTPPALGGLITTYVVEAGVTPGQPTISVATNSATPAATFTNVPPGFYYIRVRGRNNAATGSPSNEIGVPVACAAPPAPTNLAFNALGNNVTLTWTTVPGGQPPTSYILAVGSAPGASNVLSYQFPPASSLSATGPPGTYYARLHASSVCGTSAASNEVTITLPAPCVTPSAPQNFTHAVAANRVVTLSWSAPATGSAPFTYAIEVGSAPGLSNVLVTNAGMVTSVAAQAPPGTYFVRIRATNACGTAGAPSIERTVIVP